MNIFNTLRFLNYPLRVRNVIDGNYNSPLYYPVFSGAHATLLIEALRSSQLLDQKIQSTSFGMEIYDDGRWQEWIGSNEETISFLMREIPCRSCGKILSECRCKAEPMPELSKKP